MAKVVSIHFAIRTWMINGNFSFSSKSKIEVTAARRTGEFGLLLLMIRPGLYWILQLLARKPTEEIRYPAGMRQYWMKERGFVIFTLNLMRPILFQGATRLY